MNPELPVVRIRTGIEIGSLKMLETENARQFKFFGTVS